MAFANYESKEINCKVAYFGASGSGKTENLRSIFKSTSKELQAGIIELGEERNSTRFFDFLPISVGNIGDYHLKIHLYTFPIDAIYETSLNILIRGLDGYVFVVDSQVEAMYNNTKSLAKVKSLLLKHSYNLYELPHVIQYNKRDHQNIVPIEILKSEFNPTGTKDHDAVATDSRGTLETLESLSKLIVKQLGN